MRPALRIQWKEWLRYFPGLMLEPLNAPVAAAIPRPNPVAAIAEMVTIAGVLHPTPPVDPPAAAAPPASGAAVLPATAPQVPPISFTLVTVITCVAGAVGVAFGTREPVI